MADMSDLGFDANNVKPDEGFALIPKGDYDAILISTDKRDNSKQTGKFLEFVFQILGGQYQNRQLREYLSLWHTNDQTVQISKGKLSAICRAVGVMSPKDSNELCNKPLKLSVGVRKNKETGELENMISGYKSRSAGPVAAAQPAQTQPASNKAPVAAGAAPW